MCLLRLGLGSLLFHIHLQCLRAIVVYILSCWHSSKMSWFEIIWGQKILTIFRRFLVWKDDNFDMSFSVMRQHSDPYSRVERTQLLYNFNFVCVMSCIVWFQHGAYHPEGIPNLTNSVDDVAHCSSVVSNSTTKICEFVCVWQGSSSTFTGAGSWTFKAITSVFLLLILRPTCLMLLCIDV